MLSGTGSCLHPGMGTLEEGVLTTHSLGDDPGGAAEMG
jgi:hypothetical protein